LKGGAPAAQAVLRRGPGGRVAHQHSRHQLPHARVADLPQRRRQCGIVAAPVRQQPGEVKHGAACAGGLRSKKKQTQKRIPSKNSSAMTHPALKMSMAGCRVAAALVTAAASEAMRSGAR
jgi:hypothetical protein